MSERRVPKWIPIAAIALAVLGITHLLFRQRAQRRALREAGFVSVSPRSWREDTPRAAVIGKDSVAVAWLAYAREARAADHVGVRLLAPAAHASSDSVDVRVPGRAVAAPTVLADGRGGAWLVLLGVRGDDAGAPDARVFATHAAEGGLAFDPVRELERGEGMALAGGPRAAMIGGTPYVAMREEKREEKRDAVHARIVMVDAARPSAAPIAVAEGDGLAATAPSVCASDGRAFVAWIDPAEGVMVRAADEKLAFTSAPVRASKGGEAVALEAPTCFARGDVLTVVYGVRGSGSGPAFLDAAVIARSSDGGRSFAARSEVREPGLTLLHPAAADDGSGGVLLVYYAGRDAFGAPGAVRWGRIALNAQTNEPVIAREVRAPVYLISGRDDPRALGDGMGVAAGDGHLAAAFVDNAEGFAHVAYAEVGP